MFDSKENIISTIEANTGMLVTDEELAAVIHLLKLTSISYSEEAEEASESPGVKKTGSSRSRSRAFVEFLGSTGKPEKARNAVASLITALTVQE
ncbi:MAG: hypothetical protein K6A14_06720 [Erysipelotrichaceae bacterium]|nr:hypothetical protein [Erysipelotrichaceae bacterium]